MPVPTFRSTDGSVPADASIRGACLNSAHRTSSTPLNAAGRAVTLAERADPWLVQLAASLGVEIRTLVEFRSLMSQQGFRLELSRFFLDLVYAYRQLAIAHSLGGARLKSLALDLFESCQHLDQRRRQMAENAPRH